MVYVRQFPAPGKDEQVGIFHKDTRDAVSFIFYSNQVVTAERSRAAAIIPYKSFRIDCAAARANRVPPQE